MRTSCSLLTSELSFNVSELEKLTIAGKMARKKQIKDGLISPEYRDLNRELHESPVYGTSGWKYANDIIQLSADNGYKTVLDYGCGKGLFSKALEDKGSTLIVHEYDPAIPGKDFDPPACDIVLCSDVLEHVEPEKMSDVIAHIASKSNKAAFLAIATRAAKKDLPDGRNAHLSVQTTEWWLDALSRNFEMVHTTTHIPDFLAVVARPIKR